VAWRNFNAIRDTFQGSTDEDVKSLGYSVSAHFARQALRPAEQVLAERRSLTKRVGAGFPPQLAAAFAKWIRVADDFYQACESGDLIRIQDCYKIAWSDFYEVSLRLHDLLPFLLMLSMNRLDPDAVRAAAPDESAKAVKFYKAFYYASADRQLDSDRMHLLAWLIELFRVLCRKGVLTSDFLFSPLLAKPHDFDSLFPERFDALLRWTQVMRNTVHSRLYNRPPSVLEPVVRLVDWCLLDVVAILSPIFERYVMFWTDKIDKDGNALGLEFSGDRPPRAARFLLPQGGELSAIQPGELYLVLRAKEGSEPGAGELLACDYLNLTPFLIYVVGRFDPRESLHAAPIEVGRELFIFSQYAEKLKEANFRELASSYLMTIPRKTDPTLGEILGKLQEFREAIRRLEERLQKPVAPAARSIHPSWVQTKTWEVSKEHFDLASDAAQYDPSGSGERNPDVPKVPAKSAYAEDRFVAPAETQEFDRFLASGTRGLILVGPSGAGKSNLLCHYFLKLRRAGEFTLFLAGRRMRSAVFREFFQECVGRIYEGWEPRNLDEYLDGANRKLTIFVDAVNEYNLEGGPPKLLDSLVEFAKDINLFRNARLIVTCRSETWAMYKEDPEARKRLLEARYFHTGDAMRIGDFEQDDARRELYEIYQRYYALRPADYRELGPAVRNLIRAPFMMSVIAETYSNREGSGAMREKPQIIPRDLDYFRLFQLLTERKLKTASVLIPKSDPRSWDFESAASGCLSRFAELLFDQLTDTSGAPRHGA